VLVFRLLIFQKMKYEVLLGFHKSYAEWW